MNGWEDGTEGEIVDKYAATYVSGMRPEEER